MRAHDRSRPHRRCCRRTRRQGGTAAGGRRLQLDRYPGAIRRGTGATRRLRAGTGAGARAAGCRYCPPGLSMAPRRLTRRHVAGAIAGAMIGLPAVARAAPRDAGTAIRLRRGMNLWPWFSLTREFPPPRIDYDWPPYEPARAV